MDGCGIWEKGYRILFMFLVKQSFRQCTVLEKTLESPLDYKEIQPINPKGSQP